MYIKGCMLPEILQFTTTNENKKEGHQIYLKVPPAVTQQKAKKSMQVNCSVVLGV